MKKQWFSQSLRCNGFTVLELSVVTTIVGLLIGALVVGLDLLHVSRMQRTLVQMDEINKAVGTFNEKYHAFPGDMPNATSFWGTDAGCPFTPYTATPHKETCNGNGNTHIGDAFTDGGLTSYELFRAWQQLSNAGLYDGAFNGISGTLSAHSSLVRINVPEASLESAGYTLLYVYMPVVNADYWPAKYGHSVVFGRAVPGSITAGAALKPAEAFALDEKIDDGRPAYGKLMTHRSNTAPACTTSDTAASSSYNFAFTGLACGLIFITGY